MEASLAKHSIKELETPQYKEDLLNSLKKGNLQSVTFVVKGVESKQYIEANPQFKTVNVYDNNLQRINHRESNEEKQKETQGKSASKDSSQTKESVSDEVAEVEKKDLKEKTKLNLYS
ncbi:hypothetical protein [Flavobacterium sp. N502540]|uniref:hypothetical protein n=1 Tax=Flavobacterium sp. N502540 TaxID=2986838 RepID=UPI002224E84D|nr:hypothetical protein [Flavobacterium sp. N502540]